MEGKYKRVGGVGSGMSSQVEGRSDSQGAEYAYACVDHIAKLLAVFVDSEHIAKVYDIPSGTGQTAVCGATGCVSKVCYKAYRAERKSKRSTQRTF